MTKSKSLKLHLKLKGKLEIKSKIAIKDKQTLAKIYTPGVSDAVSEIARDKNNIYPLTIKNDTVAVITDGSAVLGMGNVGALAALPVMEGKCALFKEFSGLNAFPICLATQNSREILKTIKYIAPVFAAINLEDIAAPKCFEIEKKLQNLGIPVVHDDQHATAIIVLSGLINATKVADKDLKKCRITVNGCGAAGTAIIKLLNYYGARNLIAVDSKGIIYKNRSGLNQYKKQIALFTNGNNIRGMLNDAVKNCDILIGVSHKGLFSKQMINSMNKNPIIFALANPDPEITRKDAEKAGCFIYASGRSDDINQINNALVFPGFFKGLIINKIAKVSESMKIKTAFAIAKLVKSPSKNHIVPDIFDKRLVKTIVSSLGNKSA